MNARYLVAGVDHVGIVLPAIKKTGNNSVFDQDIFKGIFYLKF